MRFKVLPADRDGARQLRAIDVRKTRSTDGRVYHAVRLTIDRREWGNGSAGYRVRFETCGDGSFRAEAKAGCLQMECDHLSYTGLIEFTELAAERMIGGELVDWVKSVVGVMAAAMEKAAA